MAAAIKSTGIKAISGVDIAASWDLQYKDLILDVIERCKTDGNLAKSFYDALKWAVQGYNHNIVLKPQNIGVTLNKMTDPGIQRHGELICKTSSKLFTHFAIGTGNSATTSTTKALDAEIARANMDSDKGFRVPAGSNIIECGYFDETYPTYTAAESGCFDGDGTDPTTEVLEWRAVYPPSQQVTHTININFMTYIHTIFQRAV